MIKFLRGIKNKYNPDLFKNYIYFTTDTKEIIVNGESYGFDSQVNFITKVDKGSNENELIFTYRDGTIFLFAIPIASNLQSGLMSKEDKIKLDDVYERLYWVE